MYPLPALARLHNRPRFGPDMTGTGTRSTTGFVIRLTDSGRRNTTELDVAVSRDAGRPTNRGLGMSVSNTGRELIL